MSSTTLTKQQRAALFFAAARHRDWLKKVAKRAREQRWPTEDPVLVATDRAAEALQALVSAVFASGPVHAPMPPLPSRAEEMARRKRGGL